MIIQWIVNTNFHEGELDIPLNISFTNANTYAVFISLNNGTAESNWGNISGVKRKSASVITLRNNHSTSQPYCIFAIGY